MAKKEATIEEKKDPSLALLVAKQMVTLATSGFGLVAALAWNNLIKEFVDNYINKWLPNGGSLLSLLIYALIITALAVLVTTNLTRTVDRLEKLGEERRNEKK
jgi:hypothetical protein